MVLRYFYLTDRVSVFPVFRYDYLANLPSVLRRGGTVWRPMAAILFLAAILFFKILPKFVQIVHTNFHAKSGVCCSKNERVMALGTKEDKHLSIIYIQVIIQSKLHFSYSRRKNPNKWIFAPAMSTSYLFLCDTYNRTETLVYIFKIESF